MKSKVMHWSATALDGKRWHWLSRVADKRLLETIQAEYDRGEWLPGTVAAVPAKVRLTPAQAAGTACVSCGRNYLMPGPTPPRFPVGISHDVRRVFACFGECASRYRVPTGLRMSTTEPPQEGSS